MVLSVVTSNRTELLTLGWLLLQALHLHYSMDAVGGGWTCIVWVFEGSGFVTRALPGAGPSISAVELSPGPLLSWAMGYLGLLFPLSLPGRLLCMDLSGGLVFFGLGLCSK